MKLDTHALIPNQSIAIPSRYDLCRRSKANSIFEKSILVWAHDRDALAEVATIGSVATSPRKVSGCRRIKDAFSPTKPVAQHESATLTPPAPVRRTAAFSSGRIG
jgi:hypothetical protein